MIKEKPRQVRRDMGVWRRSSTFTMVIIRHLASRPLPPTLNDISLRVMVWSGHTAVGGHSTNTAAYMNGS